MPGHIRDLRDRRCGYNGPRPYQARWTHPHDPSVKRDRSFATKREANAWMADQDTDARRGSWVDPNAGRLTFAAVATEWQESRINIAPKTRNGHATVLKVRILPTFGERRIAAIDAADIQKWVNTQAERYAPGTVQATVAVFNQVMKFAVKRGRIAINPCVGIERPSKVRRIQIRPLTHGEVRALAGRMPTAADRVAILVAAYMGLRAGELWALQVEDVNLLHREMTVRYALKEVTIKSAERLPEGHTRLSDSLIMGPTKTHAVRKLSIPAFLVAELESVLPPNGGFLFTDTLGGPNRHCNWTRRVWYPANPGIRFHDLRHTCAALLIEAGRHPFEIKQHLGHNDIKTTFNTYGHLFPAGQEALAAALDAGWHEAQTPPQLAQIKK